MQTNKETLDIVTHSIDIAIDSVGTVLDLFDECGLDESTQALVKESMLTCLQELSTTFDKLAFAKEEN
nr:MAG TPA: hypothetical protein [Caudoviricetes sp.]